MVWVRFYWNWCWLALSSNLEVGTNILFEELLQKLPLLFAVSASLLATEPVVVVERSPPSLVREASGDILAMIELPFRKFAF